MRVLCIQPHNDDCSIGIGGTLVKLVQRQAELVFICLTDGSHGSNTVSPKELVPIRKQEGANERSVLGVNESFDLSIEDGTLASLAEAGRQRVQATLADRIRSVEPDVICIPSRSEEHPDHRATHELALASCEQAAPEAAIVKFSVWLMPPFISDSSPGDPADLAVMVGIDEELDRKLEAIRQHHSQVSRGRYDERALALSHYLGLALKSSKFIQSSDVEVLGVFWTDVSAHKVDEFMKMLSPWADITNLGHGRTDERRLG